MSDLVLNPSPEIRERLEAIALKLGKSLDECLSMAVEEFLDGWETYLASVDAAGDGEDRPSLKIVND